MANRYPLILDTSDGNKIKELPADDNLYLRTNNIHDVQDINALGTINAADIRIAGQRLQPQSLLDLTDTPTTYLGQANRLLKVNSDANGLDFVDLSNLGDFTAGLINLEDDIIPTISGINSLGSETRQFSELYAIDSYTNLRGYDGTLIFDAANNQLLYSAIVGAPNSLSEFTNDVGYVTLSQVSDYVSQNVIVSDFVGSVFGDDSTILVDGNNNRINPLAVYGDLGGDISTPLVRTSEIVNDVELLITTDGIDVAHSIDILTGGIDSFINIISSNIQILGDIVNTLQLENGINVKNGITGELYGSVFGEDSSLIIDSVNNEIHASINDLKIIGETSNGNEVLDSTDPIEWLKITVNGNIRYIKLYA